LNAFSLAIFLSFAGDWNFSFVGNLGLLNQAPNSLSKDGFHRLPQQQQLLTSNCTDLIILIIVGISECTLKIYSPLLQSTASKLVILLIAKEVLLARSRVLLGRTENH
jgi:hypothetical protein